MGDAAEIIKRDVLVVDANIDDLFYTCKLLQKFGCGIVTAHTADKAIEFMAVAQPAAIVIDVDQGGNPLISLLRQDPRYFDIPLILLSWWPNPQLELETRLGKFVAFLRKPVKALEFHYAVETAFEKNWRGKRRSIRTAAHLKVGLESGRDGHVCYATMISEYGMFIRTLDPYPVYTRFRAALEIDARIISMEMLVLYTIAFDSGPFKEPGMGMKFVQIDRADREFIAAYILDQVEKGPAR